MTHIQQMTI